MSRYDQEVKALCQELIEKSAVPRGGIFVLGLSTSEVHGEKIGSASSLEIGREIVGAVHEICQIYGLKLAVQGCEHINRALTVERSTQQSDRLSEVTVKPALHAGGAGSVAAWELFSEPCCVEFISADLGLDIGDTSIGMHVRHVQVPVRLTSQSLGSAHVTALRSRPKLIGGPRAEYPL